MCYQFFPKTEAGHVLYIFLNFRLISASCSYEIGFFLNLIGIGVCDGVVGQGQYWLFHHQKSDFRSAFSLVGQNNGPAKSYLIF